MLWAIHLSDGVVQDAWMAAGWVVAGVLVLIASRRVSEAEIPRIGVLTAAFFVASQIHLPLGGVSVHLLLNGLVGVVLRWRSALAIAVGLTLQTLLFGHGGVTTLGLNIAQYAVPAYLAAALFVPGRRLLGTSPTVRLVTTTTATFALIVTGILAAQWLTSKVRGDGSALPSDFGALWIADPLVAGAAIVGACVIGLSERKLEPDAAFPLGLLLGGLTAYLTVALNCGLLVFAGRDEVKNVASVVLLAHLPVVVVEAVAVGFVVSFLSRAKPEWLGGHASGNTSSNGTSH